MALCKGSRVAWEKKNAPTGQIRPAGSGSVDLVLAEDLDDSEPGVRILVIPDIEQNHGGLLAFSESDLTQLPMQDQNV